MAPGAKAAFKGSGFRMISQEIDRIPLDKGGLFFYAEIRSSALSRCIDDLKTSQCFIKSTINSSRDVRLRLLWKRKHLFWDVMKATI